MARLDLLNEQVLAGSIIDAPRRLCVHAQYARSASVAVALQNIWENRKLAHRVKTSSVLTAFCIGQLTPDMRTACCAALKACGVSREAILNTSTAASLVSEVLGRVERALLKIVRASCTLRLLQSELTTMGTAVTASQQQTHDSSCTSVVPSASETSVPLVPPSLHALLTEATMLVMLLDTATLQPDPDHLFHVWMAVGAKLAVLYQATHSAVLQHGINLGPAIVKPLICKALHAVQVWLKETARNCTSSSFREQDGISRKWEQLVPPVGPLQVIYSAICGVFVT